MPQQTFANSQSFFRKPRTTRKQAFLAEMDAILPWDEMQALIEPVYPQVPVGSGTRPIPLPVMLRMLLLGVWFNLSDVGVEDSLYDTTCMREFVGVDVVNHRVPDATTLCKFRKLLNDHDLHGQLFQVLTESLGRAGLQVQKGTVVDATIIHAPTSTKNKEKQRDPEMASTRKGGQWYFGMKLHIGADSKFPIAHTVSITPANPHDSTEFANLLHGDETRVYGDPAYHGEPQKAQIHAIGAKDFTQKRAYRNTPLTEDEKQANTTKAKIRCRVEHFFHVLKNIFGAKRVRYKGIDKNGNFFFLAMGLVNIYMNRKRLLAACA